jgi:transposase
VSIIKVSPHTCFVKLKVMAKYNSEIAKRICKLVEKDSYTDKEICDLVGIAESTFYEWKAKKPEFSEAIKKAERKFLKYIASEAKKSLLKKIQGYTVQEKKTVYASQLIDGKASPKIKEQTVTDKHYQPDTVAIIFALTNQDGENFKNRQSTELTGVNGKDLVLSPVIMTKEEVKRISEQLNADC